MTTVHVSPEFPLNRRMRKAVRRGKLQVVRVPGERLSLGGGTAIEARRAVRTFSSPLVCMADNGAEVGGGTSDEKKGNKAAEQWLKHHLPRDDSLEGQARYMVQEQMGLRRPLGLDDYYQSDAFCDLITKLDEDEKRFVIDRETALSKFDEQAEKILCHPEDHTTADGLMEERCGIVKWHGGIRPLFTRYGVLIMACSMVEWYARSTQMREMEETIQFLRLLSYEQGDDGKKRRDARGQEWLKKAIEAVRQKFFRAEGKEASDKILTGLLPKKDRGKILNAELQVLRDLTTVRHALVHSGGNLDMAQDPDKAKEAAKALGFTVGRTMKLLDASEEESKAHLFGEYILIGKGQLNCPIKRMGTLLDEVQQRRTVHIYAR